VEKQSNNLVIRCRCAFLVVCLIVSSVATLSGQSFQVHHYNETSGLPNAVINQAAQDQWGRLWFATRGGISCYDGVSWTAYDTGSGLPVASFIHIAVDSRGHIRALSTAGLGNFYLLKFDGTQWEIIGKVDRINLTVNDVSSFQIMETEGEQPIVLVGTFKGLLVYRNGAFTLIRTGTNPADNAVMGLAVLDGRCWIATEEGIALWTPTEGATVNRRDLSWLKLPSMKLKGIAVEDKQRFKYPNLEHSRIWLAGEDWIGYCETDSKKQVYFPLTRLIIGNEEWYRLQPDYRGGVFLGNKMQVSYFNTLTRTYSTLTTANGLIADGVNSMYIDFEKNIWFCSDRGVSKMVGRRFVNFNKNHGMLEDEVASILQYEPGRFILGHNKGVSFRDTRTQQIRIFPFKGKIGKYEPLCRVLDIKMDPAKNIWMAIGGAGLARFDRGGKTFHWIDPAKISVKGLNGIFIDKRDRLWMAADEGFFLYRGDEQPAVNYIPRLRGTKPTSYRKIFAGNGSKLYIATMNYGVDIFDTDTGTYKNIKTTDSPKIDSVYAVLEMDRKHLLVGTLNGLYETDFQKNVMYKFNRNGFHFDRPVYFLKRWTQGRIWLGSDNGVCLWNPADGSHVYYSTDQGLTGLETNRAACVPVGEREVWIGTNRGLSIYNEQFDDLLFPGPRPKVRFLEIESNLRRIQLLNSTAQSLSLDSGTHTLQFLFRGISFVDENGIRFSYRLEGLENEWVREQFPYKQSVRYGNLEAGRYRFMIKARNVNGVWSETIFTPWIEIRLPVYRQWWFFLVSMLVTGTLLWGVIRFFAERRYAGLLEKQVEERTHQLQLVERQLMQAQKMEAIGTLAGGIAHDFNNILGVITGYSELVLDDLEEGSLPHDNTRQIMTAAQRAAELVKQILAFSRQSERERNALDVRDVVLEALKLLRSSLPATIEIKRGIGVQPTLIMGDSTQIHQVIMNLCANAAHAMREKGGVLDIRLDNLFLDAQAARKYHHITPGPYVRLTVGDTGHGISEAEVKRIFEPYFTTKPTGEGTGMGLAVVHGIVKSYNGDISVFSEPGKGTTFYVFFPQAEGTEPGRQSSTENVIGGNEGILLIDDETALVEAGTQMLTRLGYNVKGFSDPVKAMAAFKENPDAFDLVITDHTMPRMTGFQVARYVKEIKPGIPVILCSGFSAAASQEEIDKLVEAFVMKPVIRSELARSIRSVLEKR